MNSTVTTLFPVPNNSLKGNLALARQTSKAGITIRTPSRFHPLLMLSGHGLSTSTTQTRRSLHGHLQEPRTTIFAYLSLCLFMPSSPVFGPFFSLLKWSCLPEKIFPTPKFISSWDSLSFSLQPSDNKWRLWLLHDTPVWERIIRSGPNNPLQGTGNPLFSFLLMHMRPFYLKILPQDPSLYPEPNSPMYPHADAPSTISPRTTRLSFNLPSQI